MTAANVHIVLGSRQVGCLVVYVRGEDVGIVRANGEKRGGISNLA